MGLDHIPVSLLAGEINVSTYCETLRGEVSGMLPYPPSYVRTGGECFSKFRFCSLERAKKKDFQAIWTGCDHTAIQDPSQKRQWPTGFALGWRALWGDVVQWKTGVCFLNQ